MELKYLQELAGIYGKGFDYVMFREGDIAYIFDLNKMPCVPGIVHNDSIMKVVSELARFSKSVRMVSRRDNDGHWSLPGLEETCDLVDEIY